MPVDERRCNVIAYHGYLSLCKKHLHNLAKAPAFLEVGVDRGVSFLTLTTFLARTKPEFLSVGVDIFVQDAVKLMLANLDVGPAQQSYLLEGNSLNVLPDLVKQGMKFDLLLIDGDHNYHTVKNELQFIEDLTHPHSIVIIDDYDGRWSERDLWYAERPGYEDNKHASVRIDTEKHGVKPAVDEWVSAHPQWNMSKPVMGEPIMLSRSKLVA